MSEKTLTINHNRCHMEVHSQTHPRRPRGGQSGREKRRDERFQVRAKELFHVIYQT